MAVASSSSFFLRKALLFVFELPQIVEMTTNNQHSNLSVMSGLKLGGYFWVSVFTLHFIRLKGNFYDFFENVFVTLLVYERTFLVRKATATLVGFPVLALFLNVFFFVLV